MELAQDLRYSFRLLRTNPGFAAVAILSLSLGIGATTAIFTLVDALIMKKLPVEDPDSLVALQNVSDRGIPRIFSYPMFEQLESQQKAFSMIAGWSGPLLRLEWGGEAQLVPGLLVTGNFFPLLGIKPLVGRLLHQQDSDPTSPPVAVIGYGFWERQLGRDPNVLGQVLRIGKAHATIVGVTPPEFFGLQVGLSSDIYLPASLAPVALTGFPPLHSRHLLWLHLIARLKPGVSTPQALAHLQTFWPDVLTETAPPDYSSNRRLSFLSQKLQLASASTGFSFFLREQLSRPLFLLMAVAGLVLVMACVNIATLQLARGIVRRREMAVRAAVGAGRLRVVQQLICENLLLYVMGALAGMVLAYWGSHLLVGFVAVGLTSAKLNLSIDYRTLTFASSITALSGLAFGLLPALRAVRIDPAEILKDSSALPQRRSHGLMLGRVLVTVQISLALLLLVTAGLFVKTLQNLRTADLGFPPQGLFLAAMDWKGDVAKQEEISEYYKDLVESTQTTPGMRSASLVHPPPAWPVRMEELIWIQGYSPRGNEDMSVYINYAVPNYFRTLGTPLLQGRDFSDRDNENHPKVAVVNEALARRFFFDGQALGRMIGIGKDPAFDMEIIGVVKNSKYRDIREDAMPAVYLSAFQHPLWLPSLSLIVRATGESAQVVPVLRRGIESSGRQFAISVTSFDEMMNQLFVHQRLLGLLSGFFGLTALLLTCIGLFGLLSYTVASRTREISIRISLGATQANIHSMILRATVPLLVVGVAAGLLAAAGVTRFFASLLFGLEAIDLSIFTAAAVAIALASLLAALFPSRRATKLDPMSVLRHER